MNSLCIELFPNIEILSELDIKLTCNFCGFYQYFMSPPDFFRRPLTIEYTPFQNKDFYPKTKDAVFYIMNYINEFNNMEHLK
jgi:hypothetical protein